MKKILAIILVVIVIFAIGNSCSKKNQKASVPQTTEEKIRALYLESMTAIMSGKNDSARQALSSLVDIMGSSETSDTDKKTAECVYCFAAGVFKLMITEGGISALQYPEVGLLSQNLEEYGNGGEITNFDETLSIAKEFYQLVK